MKILNSFYVLIAAFILTSCSSNNEGWESLLDRDLSHWRIYQSYQFGNDFIGRTLSKCH